jgi:glycerol-3-phosphate O-acyltransferase
MDIDREEQQGGEPDHALTPDDDWYRPIVHWHPRRTCAASQGFHDQTRALIVTMTSFVGLDHAGHWVLRKLLGVWVKVAIKPDDAAELIAARSRPVCYVLEGEAQADLAVLNEVCSNLRMPRPTRRLLIAGKRADRAYFALERRIGLFGLRIDRRPPAYLTELVVAALADPDFDVDLVPVIVFWGRAAHKEASWWRMLFTDNWVFVGRFRRFLTVVMNGRNTLLSFGEPLRLRDALHEPRAAAAHAGLSAARDVRRIARRLHATLAAQRVSTIGPDLSHRRTIVAQVLKASAVRQAVRSEMRAEHQSRRTALLTAKRYAHEIAANYSQSFVTFMSLALGRLWNQLYDGIEVENVGRLRGIGDGAEIIYVPCHRSHMDYLLLSYVIYHKGFAIPHVAAGVNLNMPVIGRYLRKGGAFFLRRSFKGNALYAAVFNRYLSVMMARGHSLEYFIEGGRSRTGRLLSPRTGMLSMTVRSFLRDPARPVVFMPVYFGYERIVEARTYIGELSGRPKEKESIFGLLRTLPALRRRFGRVYVNFGEPILLDTLLQRHSADWRREAGGGESGEPWTQTIEALAHAIITGINAAAAVTPVNLVAMAVLATPNKAIPETDLAAQMDLYQALLRECPYSPLVTRPSLGGEAIIQYVERMGLLDRQSHPLGDILHMTADNAVLTTYYRNNILHLFALPSLLACCFTSNASMRTADIQRLVWRVYPYISAELHLRWSEAEVPAVLDQLLDSFANLRLLTANADRSEWRRPAATSVESLRLSLLAAATIETIERYYLVIALLLRAGSGTIGPQALEERCHLMAQRMSLLYGFNSPEFFDKSLFRNFIDLLRRRGVVHIAPDDKLVYGDPMLGVGADAQLVLSEQIRNSILQVTLG